MLKILTTKFFQDQKISHFPTLKTILCFFFFQIKVFLDARRESDKDFCDFLQRCLESPFSRKLDLWSYLDVPRNGNRRN